MTAELIRIGALPLGTGEWAQRVAATAKGLVERIGKERFPNLVAALVGETGTGKEMLARAIHASSQVRDQPLAYLSLEYLSRDQAGSVRAVL